MTQMQDSHSQPPKTGILLVAYGSASHPGALALRGVTEKARAAFSGIPVRWAFTSPRMRSRLAEGGKKTDSVYKALCRMRFEGFSHVAVQSLHVISGIEYDILLQEVDKAKAGDGPSCIAVGRPLLGDSLDIPRVAEALVAHLPLESSPDDAIVCVGHGSGVKRAGEHAFHTAENEGGSESLGGALSESARRDVPPAVPNGYEALAAAVRKKDSRVLIGSLAGEPGLEAILARLAVSGIHKVWLMPLLAVVGKHAEEDLAGAGENSWRGRMEAAGFSCIPVLRGAAEYEGFLRIWLSHLAEAMQRLEGEGER